MGSICGEPSGWIEKLMWGPGARGAGSDLREHRPRYHLGALAESLLGGRHRGGAELPNERGASPVGRAAGEGVEAPPEAALASRRQV